MAVFCLRRLKVCKNSMRTRRGVLFFGGLLAAATLGIVGFLHGSSDAPTLVTNPVSGLRTWESGAGPRPLILLHGYAAEPEEWLPFAQTFQVSAQRRFVFPEAPHQTTRTDGPRGGRAWWELALSTYPLTRDGLPDLSRAHPPGLTDAAARIRRLLAELETRLKSPRDRQILGGFSQGAMISAEIAFRSDEPMQALILLSGATVDEAGWKAGLARRRGLPVFIAHGRQDTVLPFAASERLAQAMREAGLRVTWVPHDGIHDVPASVVDALNQFLASVDGPPAVAADLPNVRR